MMAPESAAAGCQAELHQQQRYYDSMAVVRKFGAPSFFITMTCNPKWPEIVAALPERVFFHGLPATKTLDAAVFFGSG